VPRVQVDPDKLPSVAKKYRIQGLPTILTMLNGKVVPQMTIVGYDPDRLKSNMAELKQLLAKYKKEENSAKVGDKCEVPVHCQVRTLASHINSSHSTSARL
jgi:thioredoxin-like negative regulator of GroEL